MGISATAGSNAQLPQNATDIALLDKLVTSLLEKRAEESSPSSSGSSTLKKLRPLSRSLSRSFRLGSLKRNNNGNSTLPTIVETLGGGGSSSNSQRSANDSAVKSVINTIRNAPQRFSTANDDDEESKRSLTQNILT
jgi:hypothetical protein